MDPLVKFPSLYWLLWDWSSLGSLSSTSPPKIWMLTEIHFSVKTLSGKHLVQPPSIVGVVLNLKGLSLLYSICWLPEQTKFVLSGRRFTGRIFQMWQIFSPQSWSFSLSSTSKGFAWFYLWGQRMLVVSRVHIRSSSSTPLICPLFCSLLLYQTCTSSPRYWGLYGFMFCLRFVFSSSSVNLLVCSCCTGDTVVTSLWIFWENGRNLNIQVASLFLLVALRIILLHPQGN